MRLARLLRLMLAGQALLALAWLLLLGTFGLWALAWAGVLAVVLAHAPVMLLESFALRRAAPDPDVPPPTLPELLRACLAEIVGAVVVFGWRMPFRWRRFPDHLSADARGRRGLLLVHGFVCNRGMWNGWWPRLLQARTPCIAPNLEPLFGSIDDYVPQIEAAVRRLHAATGERPLLVAHSMGGLAVRAWLRAAPQADARIHGVITIATPHHGTWLARFGFLRNTQQMRQHSRWLQQLATDEPAQRYGEFTCFYSHCDNVVFPCSTATLPGADNRHLRGHAHVHLLRHPAVLDEVLRRLAQPAASGAAVPAHGVAQRPAAAACDLSPPAPGG